jgi:hypothetical protein
MQIMMDTSKEVHLNSMASQSQDESQKILQMSYLESWQNSECKKLLADKIQVRHPSNGCLCFILLFSAMYLAT